MTEAEKKKLQKISCPFSIQCLIEEIVIILSSFEQLQTS